MILPKWIVRVNAAVLTVLSLMTFLGAVSISMRLILCGRIEGFFDIYYHLFVHSYDRGAKAYIAFMVVLAVLSFLQLASNIILFHAISKERVIVIQSWTAIYTILTAIVTNVPMLAAILCFLNSQDNHILPFIGGIFMLAVTLLHTVLAAVFTVNLKFHFEQNCEDFSPFVNEEIISGEDGLASDGMELSVIN